MTIALTNANVTLFETGETAGNNIWLDRLNSANQEFDKAIPTFLEYALSDEETEITTGAAKLTTRMPFKFTVTDVRASLATASSGGVVTVDINEGGSSILSTKLTVDENEKTSTTAAAAAVLSDTSLADDAEITFDIDTAGTGAKGLKVRIIGKRAT
jgi:hypothetical protein